MMSRSEYANFDVFLDRVADGYVARAVDPDEAGTATISFHLPDMESEVQRLSLLVAEGRGRSRSLLANEETGAPDRTLDESLVRNIGSILWEAVFNGDVRAQYRSKKEMAEASGQRLRVRLHLADVPELGRLPWEYLYVANLDRFLAMEAPVVRYLDLPERVRSITTKPPLHILVLTASPTDLPHLDTEHEWDNLNKALAELTGRGDVTLTRLTRLAGQSTLQALRQALQDSVYHVLHFMGHGDFNAQRGEGRLLFEKSDGTADAVSADTVGELLQGTRQMRLVVLNSCEGAQGGGGDPWASAAAGLIQKGVPALIAMQFPISDSAAIVLSQAFYHALAQGKAVDTSLTEARLATRTDQTPLEWGTPVLYMRTGDGRILDRGGNFPWVTSLKWPSQRPIEVTVVLVLIALVGFSILGRLWRNNQQEPQSAYASPAIQMTVFPAVVKSGSETNLQFSWAVPDATGVAIYEKRQPQDGQPTPTPNKTPVVTVDGSSGLARYSLRDTHDGDEWIYQLLAQKSTTTEQIGPSKSVFVKNNPCSAPDGVEVFERPDPGTSASYSLKLGDLCIPGQRKGDMQFVYTMYGDFVWVDPAQLKCDDAARAEIEQVAALPPEVPAPESEPVNLDAKSKLGVSLISDADTTVVAFAKTYQPRVIVLLDSFQWASRIREVSPETIIVGRMYVENQSLVGRESTDFIRELIRACKNSPDVDYWQGYNEAFQSGDQLSRYAEFEIERVEQLSAAGCKSGIGAFSTGQPDIDEFEKFVPAVEAAATAKEKGVLLLHEFSSPWMWMHTDNYPWSFEQSAASLTPMTINGESNPLKGWHTLRYRRFAAQLQAHNVSIPIIISETGLDDIQPRPGPAAAKGWRDLTQWWRGLDGKSDPISYWRDSLERDPAKYYAEQLRWYDRQLQQDDYVLGAAIFAYGVADPTWSSFDIANSRVAEYLYR